MCLCGFVQVHLGAQTPDLAGIVLHAPLLSGMRVLNPSLKWWPGWADVYQNYQLMPKVQAPVLVMHVRTVDMLGSSWRPIYHDELSKILAFTF